MSFGFFLNFEKLAVKIIDEELSKMSDMYEFICDAQTYNECT